MEVYSMINQMYYLRMLYCIYGRTRRSFFWSF